MAGTEPLPPRKSPEPQADGNSSPAAGDRPKRTEPPASVHVFSASATWLGAGDGCGWLRLPQGDVSIPIGGAKALGGCGIGANPEELLLGAIAACFINTWAVFLKKLDVTYAEPAIRVSGKLEADPAGGYRLRSAAVCARVPASLLQSERAKVEKTLSLAEKYCIISKVAKAAMPLKVSIEEV